MNAEDRLRRALAARARSVEPSPDGLQRIHDKLLEPGGDSDMEITPRNPWFIVAAAAAIVLVLGIGGLLLAGDDGGDRTSTADEPGTTTTEATTTTTEPPATTTTTGAGVRPEAPEAPEAPEGPPPTDVFQQAVWPRPSSDVRFDDPVAAARSFARYYTGFSDPQVGEYRAGDSRSGEVPVFPLTGGQGEETTVLVRQLSDDHWYVVGSVTEDVTVEQPDPGDRLTCPLTLRGTALAFEGTVQVRIDAYLPDGRRVEVGSGFVTGSGSPPAAPYEGRIACRVPDGVEPYAILHLFTPDEGDAGGNLVSVTLPIRLR
ncbi:MAG TPA: Gmad2 immunoglobulin-like domain-containing protein [Acidimicrobiales bacterium]